MNRKKAFEGNDFDDKKSLEAAFQALSLQDIWPFVATIAQPSIRIKLEGMVEDCLPVGSSKVGGTPDLPLDMQYPTYNGTPLTFIAQINLENIVQYDLDKLLPTMGLFVFFQCEEGWDANQVNETLQLVYCFESVFGLERKTMPEQAVVLKPCTMRFQSQISIPHLGSRYRPDFLEALDHDDEKEEIYQDAWSYGTYINKLLGHPDNFQNPVEVQLGWKHDDKGYLLEDSIEAAKQDAPNWQLLFQMDEDDATDLYLGSGRLYYMIRKEDLIQKNFDRIILTGQC